MAAISPILRTAEGGLLHFWCPGCQTVHGIQHGAGPGPRWTWNGNAERPTFSPSILVQGVIPLTDEEVEAKLRGEHVEVRPFLCHSFITDGRIQFLDDCTHELRGQTVDLPPLPDWLGD